jgi:hypothetical protein
MPESSQHWEQKVKGFKGFLICLKEGLIPIKKPGGQYNPKPTNKEQQERNNPTL